MSDRNESRDGSDEATAREEGGEWDGWTRPAAGPGSEDETSEGPDEVTDGYVPWKAPPSERSRTPREAVRARFDLTDREWYVVETVLLVAPYPLFVFAYLSFPIDETVFLVVTLLYSLFATYVGIFS